MKNMVPFLNETVSLRLPDSTLCFRLPLLMCVVSNLFRHRSLSALEGPSADQGGAKGGGSRRMFWELASEDVIRKPAELQCVKIEREWKRRKHKMEKPWTEMKTAQKRRR